MNELVRAGGKGIIAMGLRWETVKGTKIVLLGSQNSSQVTSGTATVMFCNHKNLEENHLKTSMIFMMQTGYDLACI